MYITTICSIFDKTMIFNNYQVNDYDNYYDDYDNEEDDDDDNVMFQWHHLRCEGKVKAKVERRQPTAVTQVQLPIHLQVGNWKIAPAFFCVQVGLLSPKNHRSCVFCASLDRYVDRYLDWVSVDISSDMSPDISVDISVEMCQSTYQHIISYWCINRDISRVMVNIATVCRQICRSI